MMADAKPSDFERAAIVMVMRFEPPAAPAKMGQFAATRLCEHVGRNRFADFEMGRILFCVAGAIALHGERVQPLAAVRSPVLCCRPALTIGTGRVPQSLSDAKEITVSKPPLLTPLCIALAAIPGESIRPRPIAGKGADDLDGEAACATLATRAEPGRKTGDFELFEVDHQALRGPRR